MDTVSELYELIWYMELQESWSIMGTPTSRSVPTPDSETAERRTALSCHAYSTKKDHHIILRIIVLLQITDMIHVGPAETFQTHSVLVLNIYQVFK